jgi:hypothetical protein
VNANANKARRFAFVCVLVLVLASSPVREMMMLAFQHFLCTTKLVSVAVLLEARASRSPWTNFSSLNYCGILISPQL